jgi:hypothetical protein
LHQAVVNHARLEAEKPKVQQVARTARPIINDFRYAQQRLERIKHDLEELNGKYPRLWEPQLNEHIHTALEHVEAFKCLIADKEKLWISRVHTKLRKPKDVPSKWDSFLKGYDYELDSLHAKAADQWFWREVNRQLGLVRGRHGGRLSNTTKFKLIAAICAAADIGTFEPTTIKEFLRKSAP